LDLATDFLILQFSDKGQNITSAACKGQVKAGGTTQANQAMAWLIF